MAKDGAVVSLRPQKEDERPQDEDGRPKNEDEHARAETERKRVLFEWADGVLDTAGLTAKVRRATTADELRRILFDDADASAIDLAIQEALHPASGQRKSVHFTGLKPEQLMRLLKTRFRELKKQREWELRHGQTGAPASDDWIWTDDLKLDKKGAVRPLLHNLIVFLSHHPQWKGVLGFNEFSMREVIRQRPPWGEEAPDAPWTDHHATLTRKWFQVEDIVPTLGDVGRAVPAAARENIYHPVRDYFSEIENKFAEIKNKRAEIKNKRDDTPCIDTWLVTYFHAEDTPYIRAIGSRWLMSSVARIYKPGCQADYTLLLEGPQGKLKSQALRALCKDPQWFTDKLSHIGSKDAIYDLAGRQIVELSEMDAINKAAASASKAFLTRMTDPFRPVWGKHTINVPRQNVFAATVNPPETGGYLTDPTGARRFWMFLCREIDIAGIIRDRDQLWAEAIQRFNAGAPWHLETPALEALATAEQKLRYKPDAWLEPVAEWIGPRNEVSISEVLAGALNDKFTHRQDAMNRVAKILVDDLGFHKCRPRKDGKREWRYRR